MLCPVAGAPAYQVVAPLINQPVQNAETKKNCKAQHFVDVEGVSEDDGEEEELQNFLLALFEHVFLLDYPNISKKYPNQQIGELDKYNQNGIEENHEVEFLRCQLDQGAECCLVVAHCTADNLTWHEHAQTTIDLEQVQINHFKYLIIGNEGGCEGF